MSCKQQVKLLEARTALALRILLVSMAFVLFIACLFLTPLSIEGWGDAYRLVFWSSSAVFFLWSLVHILRARVVIYETGILRVGLLKRWISYSQVHTVSFYHGCLTVYSKEGSAKLSKDLDRQEDAMIAVARALKDRADLRVKGDREMAEVYFGRSAM
jgi:hypothetical protein